MKFSLIINTYNRPHLLKSCLVSISNQSELPNEIVVSDDGSEEDIISILKSFKKRINKPILYVTQKDAGFRLARCRNNGARVASGDYLFYIDQDLVFTKNFMRHVRNNIKENYFIVGWPIRTSEKQLEQLSLEKIKKFDYYNILNKSQLEKVRKQYSKDFLYRILYKLKLRKYGSKFRGGVAGFFKKDYIKINGYDEKYIGWGNEDDDFGRRLYLSGVKGINPFKAEFPIHLWHQEFHENGKRVNKKYFNQAKKYLNKNNFVCEFGYNKTLGKDKFEIVKI